jgi:hypothetical protein
MACELRTPYAVTGANCYLKHVSFVVRSLVIIFFLPEEGRFQDRKSSFKEAKLALTL